MPKQGRTLPDVLDFEPREASVRESNWRYDAQTGRVNSRNFENFPDVAANVQIACRKKLTSWKLVATAFDKSRREIFNRVPEDLHPGTLAAQAEAGPMRMLRGE